jgi:CRISPR-associated protein Csm1
METQYLIKGDISGIQEFIFNVSSQKAAKTLKFRSSLIQTLAELCVTKIQQDFGTIE